MKRKRQVPVEPLPAMRPLEVEPLDENHLEQQEEMKQELEANEQEQSEAIGSHLSRILFKNHIKEISQLPDGRIKVRRSSSVSIWPAGTLHLIPPFSNGEPLPKNYMSSGQGPADGGG